MQGAFSFALAAHNSHVLRLFDKWVGGRHFDWSLSYQNDRQMYDFILDIIKEHKIAILDFESANFAIDNILSISADKGNSDMKIPMAWLGMDVFLQGLRSDDGTRLGVEYTIACHIDKLCRQDNAISLLLINRSVGFIPKTKDLKSRLSYFYQEELRYAPSL